jgi:simple sugar transport system ATP-binding protein
MTSPALDKETVNSKPEETLVKMMGIHKWFGKVHALKGVDFEVKRSQVVGLVGDNGAGKSTLIKVLSGVHIADKGEIYFEGEKVNITSPAYARRLGIETVYQEQALAPNMSISRNIFMGREPTTSFGFMDKKRMNEESMNSLGSLGLYLRSPEIPIVVLSGGQRQGVAIVRALHFKAKLVVLDEPTIALSVKETQEVLAFIERLKEEGISVIFITHNLYHVFPVADRFVVLTRGEKTADVKKGDMSVDELTELIVSGRHLHR